MQRNCHRRFGGVVALLALMLPLSGAAQEFVFAVNEGVTYHVTPHETREKYRDLAQQLAKLLKQLVRVQPVSDYPTLARTLQAGGYHLA